jgi:ligand-binding sensor domain-containing protein
LVFKDGEFKLVREIETIKSLAVDPAREGRLVLCTNTGVWYSEDGGKRWKDIGAPSTVPGAKAVSFGPWDGSASHAVWLAHSIKGLFVRDPGNGQDG